MVDHVPAQQRLQVSVAPVGYYYPKFCLESGITFLELMMRKAQL